MSGFRSMLNALNAKAQQSHNKANMHEWDTIPQFNLFMWAKICWLCPWYREILRTTWANQ